MAIAIAILGKDQIPKNVRARARAAKRLYYGIFQRMCPRARWKMVLRGILIEIKIRAERSRGEGTVCVYRESFAGSAERGEQERISLRDSAAACVSSFFLPFLFPLLSL